MHPRQVLCQSLGFGLGLLIPFVIGCGPNLPDRVQPSAEARIAKLASICSKYATKQRKKPASIDELKSWAKQLSKPELEQLGLEDPDTAFVSPRDNQPYVLVKTPGAGPGDVIAYERTGQGGMHYIVTPYGRAFELDDAELKRRVPSAK
jgi:hypothetical protein